MNMVNLHIKSMIFLARTDLLISMELDQFEHGSIYSVNWPKMTDLLMDRFTQQIDQMIDLNSKSMEIFHLVFSSFFVPFTPNFDFFFLF